MRSDLLNKNSNKYLDQLAPEKLLSWDYISCSPPIVGNIGESADGVLADGELMSILWPGDSGQLTGSTACSIGALTAAGGTPTVVGTIAATDGNTTAAGLNLQMDATTADNTGIEIVFGGSQFGSVNNKFVVGTHSGSIDVTFNNVDWSDFDVCGVGFRKAQAFATGHGGILAAAGGGDPVYTDFVLFGCITADDVEIASDLNNSGVLVSTDSTQATAANHNHRFKVELSSAGVVTFSHIGAAAMRAGTLAAPTVTKAFTFDDGDILVPYMVVQGINQNSAVYLKSVDIERTPTVDGYTQ